MRKWFLAAVVSIGALASPAGPLYAYEGGKTIPHIHSGLNSGGNTLYPRQITVSTLTVTGPAVFSYIQASSISITGGSPYLAVGRPGTRDAQVYYDQVVSVSASNAGFFFSNYNLTSGSEYFTLTESSYTLETPFYIQRWNSQFDPAGNPGASHNGVDIYNQGYIRFRLTDGSSTFDMMRISTETFVSLGKDAAVSSFTATGSLQMQAGSTITARGTLTLSTGTAVGAATHNLHLNQIGAVESTTQIGARLNHNSTEGLPSGGSGKPVFFGAELYDRGDLHSTSASSQTITVPTGGGGIWFLTGGVSFSPNATGTREIFFLINGVSQRGTLVIPGVITDSLTLSISDVLLLNDGDTIQLWAFQNSGTALNIGNGVNVTYFGAQKLW